MSTAPSSDDYVLELVLRDGRRVRRLGHGDDETAAYEAYEQCMTRYPYFGVRLRKGGQILDYRLARPFYAPTSSARRQSRRVHHRRCRAGVPGSFGMVARTDRPHAVLPRGRCGASVTGIRYRTILAVSRRLMPLSAQRLQQAT